MSIYKYLKHYAEPETAYLTGFPSGQYHKVLCIPVYDEQPAFIDSLKVACDYQKEKTLLILVINQPENISFCSQNEELVRFINQYTCIWQSGTGIQLHRIESLDILIVDRFNKDKRIPVKKGVGLARKIACDLATLLYFNQHITEPQIYCSDADVIFPVNYFSANIPVNASAAIFNFAHADCTKTNSSSLINKLTLLYEKSLHHYVEGLRKAGSQYAFHTIGSCLLINTEYYAKVRGFPKRPGGEDFYLLNKLQKLAPVSTLEHPQITIQSRLSERVPFGTGPAINKLMKTGPQTARIFYHPTCFTILGEWLAYLDKVAKEDKSTLLNTKTERSEFSSYIPELSETFRLPETIEKIFKAHTSINARKKHLHEWFDGFKTLKAIHYLRDRHFPSMSYTELQHYQQLDTQ